LVGGLRARSAVTLACSVGVTGYHGPPEGSLWTQLALTHFGDTRHATGESAQAPEAWQQALAILEDIQHPNAGPGPREARQHKPPRFREPVRVGKDGTSLTADSRPVTPAGALVDRRHAE
jgi:hypothetical protein